MTSHSLRHSRFLDAHTLFFILMLTSSLSVLITPVSDDATPRDHFFPFSFASFIRFACNSTNDLIKICGFIFSDLSSD